MSNDNAKKTIDAHHRRTLRDAALSIRIPAAALQKLREVAYEKDQSVSSFCNSAILAALAKVARKTGQSVQSNVTP